ncbi:cyclin-domain-containing protein [Kockovaella imperatae]|uniref:Cyclin-domain-containing protein n=1 Tax=Kockovaella imperatae TaxID=4999 RepID=A0A1Y1UEA8_9TREE|nr:cyclin-domain-containing protein [Kockovaella imperatae]ORX36329.1 cyclin-domain-containing protein [Kockovaella imperatae]
MSSLTRSSSVSKSGLISSNGSRTPSHGPVDGDAQAQASESSIEPESEAGPSRSTRRPSSHHPHIHSRTSSSSNHAAAEPSAASSSTSSPSSPRHHQHQHQQQQQQQHHHQQHHRPASPDTALTRQPSPPRPLTPHLDLATFPTPTLLRLLANLLQQIALANDQLRPDFEDLQSIEEEDTLASLASTPGGNSSGGGGGGGGGGPGGGGPHDDAASSTSKTSSSQAQHPSPTTALFSDATSTAENQPASLEPHHYGPLFTASKTSLSYPSSLLSFHARHIPSITIEAYLLRILKYCPTTNEVFLGLLVYFDRMSRLGTPGGVGGESAGARRGIGRGFAIDSYNIHRLVIAGVTVASKFFSDVFYTNSRYAKVGGLPPHELNQLELQFLLLNDFRLVIPIEEMQRYGDRLLGYWEGREAEIGVDSVDHSPKETKVKTPASESKTTHTESTTSTAASTAAEAVVKTEDAAPSSSTQSQDDIKMEIDPASSSSSSDPTDQSSSKVGASSVQADSSVASTAGATTTASASATSSTPRDSSTPASRPRERERLVNFAPVPSASTTTTATQPITAPAESHGLSSGVPEWVRTGGDDAMGGVMGSGRMTSPMRE